MGAAAGAALRGLGDDDDSPANLAGAAVNVAVAGAAIWSAFSAIWLRSVLLLRSSISVADAAMAAHVDPSSLDVVGAVIAVLGVAWLVAVAATAGARARVPVAALGLSLLMLAGTGQVAMSTVSGALIVDDDGEGLLRAPGSEAGRIAGAFVLRRGASISISGDADSFDGRVALGADVDAATLVAAVKAAEDGKQTTLSIITASPPPTSTATHSFLRRLDEVAKGQETTFARCENIDDGERMPLAVMGDAWGTSGPGVGDAHAAP